MNQQNKKLSFKKKHVKISTSEWLSLTVFLGIVDIGIHVVHTSCVIIAYTLELLPNIDKISVILFRHPSFKSY